MQIHGLDPLRPLRKLPLIQPTKRATTISETTQKKITDRNREAEKRRIQVRGAAITLISNRSGCRTTPTTRPTPPPKAAKKRQSRQHTTPETARSTQISTSPAADLAAPRAATPARAAQRARSRARGGGAARWELDEGEKDEERDRAACTYHGGARDGYGGSSGEATRAARGGAAVEAGASRV